MYKIDSFENKFNGESALVCGQIHTRFKDYMVKTTDEEIKKILESAQKEDRDKVVYMFKKTYENITQYSDEELNEHFEKQTKQWQDWCNDVCLFFCYRYVVFHGKMPIPLMKI